MNKSNWLILYIFDMISMFYGVFSVKYSDFMLKLMIFGCFDMFFLFICGRIEKL